MFQTTTTEYDAEANLRIQALAFAGQHESRPATTNEVVARAEAYLKFLKGGIEAEK